MKKNDKAMVVKSSVYPGRLILVLVISWVSMTTGIRTTSDGISDLSSAQIKNLRGKLDGMTQSIIEKRTHQLMAKHRQEAAMRRSISNLSPSPEQKQVDKQEKRAVPTNSDGQIAEVVQNQVQKEDAASIAMTSLQNEHPEAKLVAPEYKNEPKKPMSSVSARFATAKVEQKVQTLNGAKVKTGAMDAKNPWWLNPPPWWLPPPPEWGSPPPSIYSGFYNPYSQPQSFHRVPPSQPAYHPYPLPY